MEYNWSSSGSCLPLLPWQCSRSAGKGRVGMQLNSACASRAVIGENIARKSVQKHSLTICWGHILESTFTPAPLVANMSRSRADIQRGHFHHQHEERADSFVQHLSSQYCCLQLPLPLRARQWADQSKAPHSVFKQPSKGLVCQEASSHRWGHSCWRATPGDCREGRAAAPQLPSGCKLHLPASLAWLLCHPHPRQLGDHFSCHPWQFGAGTGRGQLAATRSSSPARNSTLPFAARSARVQMYPAVEYQGYFLKGKLTSNVRNWYMNIHDLLGGFHNYFILLRLIWSAVATAVVYTPSSRCQQFGSMTFPVSCAGEQL